MVGLDPASLIFGFADGGVLECDIDCDEFVLDDCVDGCGNNTQEPPEACDGADLAGVNCAYFGYSGGTLGCETDCSDFDVTSCSDGCGNNIVESGEVCDGTDLNGENCTTMGFAGGTLGCAFFCDGFDLTGCTGGCGNGVAESGEDCDDTDMGTGDCTTEGFYTGTLACDGSCNFITTGCSEYCGDGTKNGPEVCDGTDFGTTTCSDYGYTSGFLVCNSGCGSINSSNCYGTCSLNESESFTSWPGGWTTIDGGDTTGDTWAIGTGYCASGSCMYVDSDYASSSTWLNEYLITPQYTVGGCTTGTVGFTHYFQWVSSTDYGEFQVSTNAVGWTTLQTWQVDISLTTESYNISSYLAGASWIQFRWHYDDDDTWACYWYVDNFTLSGS